VGPKEGRLEKSYVKKDELWERRRGLFPENRGQYVPQNSERSLLKKKKGRLSEGKKEFTSDKKGIQM